MLKGIGPQFLARGLELASMLHGYHTSYLLMIVWFLHRRQRGAWIGWQQFYMTITGDQVSW